MVAWRAELGRSFMKVAPQRQSFAGAQPVAEAERGSVEYDILRILWDGPRHGYDIILAIEQQLRCRPSPSSVYPALQMLEDGDFVTGRLIEGKRIYTLTDAGSELLAQHSETESGGWTSEPSAVVPLIARGIRAIVGLRSVLQEIAQTRNAELYAEALAIVEQARSELHAFLAQDE